MDLKDIAIQRAIKQLTNLGCTVKVATEDGTVIANTFPDEQKKRRPRKPVKQLCPYRDKLSTIQPGQLVSIDVPDGLTVKDVQASVTSYMATKFGNGSYVSERSKDHKTVTILRVE